MKKTFVNNWREIVNKYGNNICVIDGEKQISFERMDLISDYLANELKYQGLRPKDCVGICMKHSKDLIATIIALLKLGVTYVPIDPDYPTERKIRIMAEANCIRVLSLAADNYDPIKNIAIEIDWNAELEKNIKLLYDHKEDDVIYILFTSGSTGEPQGVITTNLNLCSVIENCQKSIAISPGQRVMWKTSFCFAFGIYELYWPLITGGCICVADSETRKNPKKIKEFIQKYSIQIVTSVPTLLQRLLNHGELANCNSIEIILCAGEPMLPNLVEEFRKSGSGTLYNVFGMTELTGYIIYSKVDKTIDTTEPIPLGKEICGTKCLVLDNEYNEVEDGTEGILFVCGDNVSPGYLKNITLNKERFIIYSNRTYFKTNDRVIKKDGIYYYSSREDNLIKVRGNRIDCLEIEKIISEMANIKENAICYGNDGKIVDFFVTNEENIEHTIKLMQQKVQLKLPSYMHPNKWKRIDKLPLLTNGKVDRKKLKMMYEQKQNKVTKIQKNSDSSELINVLTWIYSDVLKEKIYDRESNFYELGGTSIEAMEVIRKISLIFGIDIGVLDFANNSSITQLEKYITSLRSADSQENKIDSSYNTQLSSRMTELQESYYYDHINEECDTSITYGYLEFEIQNYNTESFKNALKDIIDRHDIMRVNFENGLLTLDTNTLYFEERELKDKEKASNSISDIQRKEIKNYRPNLSKKDPLILCIVNRNKSDSIIQLWFDTIIMDGISKEIFLSELDSLYNGNRIETIAGSFFDFLSYKSEVKKSEKYYKAKKFWENQLSTIPEPLYLPQKMRHGIEVEGNQKSLTISNEEYEIIQLRARQCKTTVFNLLFSSFALAISLWSEKKQFTLCLPETERNISDFQSMIGELSTFVPISVSLEDMDTFLDFVVRNNEIILKTQDNLSFSGIELLRMMSSHTGQLRQGVSPVIFTSLLNKDGSYNFKSIKVSYFESHTSHTQLEVVLHRVFGEVQVSYNYYENLLDDTLIDNLIETHKTIIEKIVKIPTYIYDRINVDIPQSDKKVMDHANCTSTDFLYNNITDLLLRSMDHNADRIALETLNSKMTYRDLKEQAIKVASYLLKEKVEKRTPIAIVLEKGLDQIISILGCAFAGMIYMPFEEDIPLTRLKECMKKAACKMVFSQRQDLIEDSELHILDVKQIRKLNDAIIWKLEERNENDILAIIHTSGSTGIPKAVLIKDKGVLNCVQWTNEKFNVTCDDAAIALTDVAHDMAIYDIWGILLIGGKLVIPDNIRKKDPTHWMKLIKEKGVTIWNSVPAMPEMLLQVLKMHKLTFNNKIRLFILGGDYMKFYVPQGLWKIAPGSIVVNVGGPTETTIWNIWHIVTEKDIEKGIIPYGKPIQNTQYYILNDRMERVPLGVIGELYCSGICLTGGYLNDNKSTKEKFITHKNQHLFKTGDRGRYLSNGEIEFKGRNDNQIKVNGKRIEIEEIENAIMRQSDIEQCSVCYDNVRNEIIAFCIGAKPNKKKLQELLPLYMQPSQFYNIEKFPLGRTNKIDKKELLKMAETLRNREGKSYEILNDIEKIVKNNFCKILNKDNLTKKDNFLMLGGDSLKAIKLIDALEKECHCTIDLSDFFNSPTIENTSKLIENSKKAELPHNDYKRKKENKFEAFPVSELQEAYLVGRENEMELGNVTTQGYLELECTEYSHEKFLRVLERLVQRHEMLRCVVSYDGTQKFLDKVPTISIPTTDISNCSEKEKKNHLLAVRKQMIQYNLPLDKAPLIRIKVTKVSNEKVIIHVYFDAIIIDGYSYEILHRELETLYKNEKNELPKLDITFKDYIEYKQRLKNTEKYRKAKEYWLNRIPLLPEPATLPLLKDPKEIKIIEGEQKICKLNADEWVNLCEKAKNRGVSTFIVLFTAFSLVIGKWNRKKKFLLNIPEFDRPNFHPDMEKIVGECSTFLLFEIEKIPGESFIETCRRNQKQLWEIKKYNSFNGMEILREIYKHQNTYGISVVPIVFSSLLDIPQSTHDIFRKIYTETHTSQVWIDIDAQRCDDEIQFNWDCIKGLFDSSMLEKMVELQMNILRNAAYNNEFWEKHNLNLLPKEDEKTIMALNNTKTELRFINIQSLLVISCKENAERVALVTEERQYTYSELFMLVKVTIKRLNAKGIKPRDIVAIILKKGIDQIIYTLATVLMGAIYAPIEYDTPESWIKKCLENIQADLIITDYDKGQMFNESVDVLMVGNMSADIEGDSEFYLHSKAEDIFSIIHTSGSTGVPKAVMVQQKGIQNSIRFTLRKFGITNKDSILALTNLAHDMSMFDLFGLLIAGGKIVMPNFKGIKDPDHWLGLLDKHKISIFCSVPTMLTMLKETVAYAHASKLENIRLVISGGEFFEVPLAKWIFAYMPNAKVVSVGGPTETTLWNIYHIITENDLDKKSIPYGCPIDNNQYYILDENLDLVPIGVIGMMYCAGIGVTKGYLNAPDLTKKKFIIKNGLRLYETGDLGLYNSEGEIEIIGREDLQVKINGKRVELQTIEEQIKRYKDIDSAVVIKDPIKSELLAYYHSIDIHSGDDIRKYLRKNLPDYMIPNKYMKIDQWPLNQANKIDRYRLPQFICKDNVEEIVNNNLDSNAEKILKIACKILNVSQLKLSDNFFYCGGNSLKAIRFCSEVRKAFQCQYSLTTFFEKPIFKDVLSSVSLHKEEEKLIIQKVPYDSFGDKEYSGALSSAQEGVWLYEMLHNDNKFTLIGMVDIYEKIDEQKFKKAINRVVEKHDMLRMQIDINDEFIPYQNVLKRRKCIPKIKEILSDNNLKEELIKLNEKKITTDSKNLYNIELWKIKNTHYKLIVCMHHIISDEASFQIFIKDLNDAYLGRALEINEFRYCDYAYYDRKRKPDLQFWGNLLSESYILSIPGSKATIDYNSSIGKTVNININMYELEKLKEIFKRNQITLYMGFYTLFVKFLYDLTGERTLYIGSPVSTREKYNMQNVIGLFAQMSIFKFEIGNFKNFSDLSIMVKNSVVSILDHASKSFDVIANELKLPADLKGLPFHVHYNYIEENTKEYGIMNDNWKPLEYVKNTIQHNFGLYIEKRNEKILIQFTFKESYLDHSKVREFAKRFEKLIRNIIGEI